MWNPFRSKLAAAILGGVEAIHIKPGAKVSGVCEWLHMFSDTAFPQVLYLGAASGTTVSHVSDVVGPVSLDWRDRRFFF